MVRIAIKINLELKYISDYFIVDAGSQNIICNIDSLRELPNIKNKYMAELNGPYANAYMDVNNDHTILNSWYDSLKSIYKNKIPAIYLAKYADKKDILVVKSKMTLLEYTREHPNSFVALWEIVNGLHNGYDSTLDSSYKYLSRGLQSNFTGTALRQKLTQLKAASIGAEFPKLSLADINLKGTTFDSKHMGTKYTLVDFWYSHCGPCISQFGKLKDLYYTFRPKGFEIIGISTDNEKYIRDWKGIIKQYNLPWSQFLDINGTEAGKLSITMYPFNFLCDAKGKIIQIDMQPAQISAFLKEKLVEHR
jgi:peroxiredoxin